MTKKQEALLVRLEAWFLESGGGSEQDAANSLQMPVQAVEAVAKLGIHENRLVRVGDRLVTMTMLRATVTELHGRFGDRPLHPREVREALGFSRQRNDELADALERQGLLARSDEGWRLKQSS